LTRTTSLQIAEPLNIRRQLVPLYLSELKEAGFIQCAWSGKTRGRQAFIRLVDPAEWPKEGLKQIASTYGLRHPFLREWVSFSKLRKEAKERSGSVRSPIFNPPAKGTQTGSEEEKSSHRAQIESQKSSHRAQIEERKTGKNPPENKGGESPQADNTQNVAPQNLKASEKGTGIEKNQERQNLQDVNYSALTDGASGRDKALQREPSHPEDPQGVSCFNEGWLTTSLEVAPPVPSPQA